MRAIVILSLCAYALLTQQRLVSSEFQNNYAETKEKRILLNDPDIAGAKLTQLEMTVQEMTRKMAQMESSLSQVQTELANEKSIISKMMQTFDVYGSSYVHWGKMQCTGSNTETIYSGFAAGNRYYFLTETEHRGGPANMLCLPNNPEMSNKTATGNSFIYGTEFEDTFFAPDAPNEDVPCARCRSLNTTSSIMIPGRKTCYSGWKTEYYGYIVSGYPGHSASSYICVDIHPDYVQGGKADLNGQLLYPTASKCGSLPCPPYIDDLALYCVVCSK